MKKLRLLFLCFFATISIAANAIIQQGSCGDNVTFVLNDDGTLVISGTGVMKNYYYTSDVPWCDNRSKIIKVTINNGVTSIGRNAFYYCSSLTSVTIPNSVTSIGDAAFYGCSSLTSVTIPNSVTSIGSSAFYKVNNIVYNGSASGSPWGAKTLNGYAEGYLVYKDESKRELLWCSTAAKGEIVIPNSVTSIGGSAFSDISGLTTVTIPNSVTSIGGSAFYGCKGLTSVTIGNSVTSIGSDAFYNCSSLTSVTIGNSVTSIGQQAFDGCYRLTHIYMMPTTPPVCISKTFYCSNSDLPVRDKYDVYTYTTLHVPMGTKEDYSSAYEWRYFNKIKEDTDINGKTYYTTLSVKQGIAGYVEHYVKADDTYTLFIGETTGSKINTVMFNGEDVTDKLEDGYFTTPAITRASTLTVSFEQTTAAKPLFNDNSNIRVYGNAGRLYISGIDDAYSFGIYRSSGEMVRNGKIEENTCIDLPDDIYIVKVGQRTFKVAM